MRADVNVMARIRPTVTADEEDVRENVKMEEPFVPHNFPRANVASNAIEKKKKKAESQGEGRRGARESERARRRKREKKINQIESVSRTRCSRIGTVRAVRGTARYDRFRKNPQTRR